MLCPPSVLLLATPAHTELTVWELPYCRIRAWRLLLVHIRAACMYEILNVHVHQVSIVYVWLHVGEKKPPQALVYVCMVS